MVNIYGLYTELPIVEVVPYDKDTNIQRLPYFLELTNDEIYRTDCLAKRALDPGAHA